jgi:hypothetical protein
MEFKEVLLLGEHPMFQFFLMKGQSMLLLQKKEEGRSYERTHELNNMNHT